MCPDNLVAVAGGISFPGIKICTLASQKLYIFCIFLMGMASATDQKGGGGKYCEWFILSAIVLSYCYRI